MVCYRTGNGSDKLSFTYRAREDTQTEDRKPREMPIAMWGGVYF